MFDRGEEPGSAEVEEYAERARVAFGRVGAASR
jgi:hypothetical protein